MKRERNALLLAARYVSLLFTPFFLPVMGLIALFIFSYLSMMPFLYKVTVVVMVWLFTVIMPQLLIRIYRHYQGWHILKMLTREGRMIPYAISLTCYVACYYVMHSLHMPHFMSSILVAALLVQIVCALINVWWKVSTHTAAIGGVGGALFAFAEYLNFNPVWWLCLIFLIAGMVGTSRMILRQHSLAQVVGGFWIGFVCAAIAILFL